MGKLEVGLLAVYTVFVKVVEQIQLESLEHAGRTQLQAVPA